MTLIGLDVLNTGFVPVTIALLAYLPDILFGSDLPTKGN